MMLEEVARGLFENLRKAAGNTPFVGPFQGNTVFDSESNDTGRSSTTIDGEFDLKVLARAAIEAMREPTRKMQDAGAFYFIEGAGAASESDMRAAAIVWCAMIDAALNESPSSPHQDTHPASAPAPADR